MSQRPRGEWTAKAPQQQGYRRRPYGGTGPVAGWSDWGAGPWSAQDTQWWGQQQGDAGTYRTKKPAEEASVWPEGTEGKEAEEAKEARDVAAATESLLDALAPRAPATRGAGPSKRQPAKKSWLVADARPISETPTGLLSPDKLLGHWVDSQGNSVHVFSTDAFDVKLVATLSKPPRADIHLSVKPVMLGGGWQCGHSLLDPLWSTPSQLHWVAMDGRVSVWVRPQGSETEAGDERAQTEAPQPPEEGEKPQAAGEAHKVEADKMEADKVEADKVSAEAKTAEVAKAKQGNR